MKNIASNIDGGKQPLITEETENLEEYINNIRTELRKFSYFDDWDEFMIEECCKLSKIGKYAEGEIILGDDKSVYKYAYFVLDGSCSVVQFIQSDSHHTTISRINERKEIRKNEIHFIKVCAFSKMACLNLGEDLHNRMIISSSHETKCLLIPTYWLLDKNERKWHRIRSFFEHNIPSSNEVMKRYRKRRLFAEYSRNLVNEIMLKSKKSQINEDYNIPISLLLN